MKYTPERPTYEMMRDGILQAVAAKNDPDGDSCRVWTAFAHYGVGVGAKATVKGSRVTIRESFAKPSNCP
jgi:extracellular elastinolytic metalloproteinase